MAPSPNLETTYLVTLVAAGVLFLLSALGDAVYIEGCSVPTGVQVSPAMYILILAFGAVGFIEALVGFVSVRPRRAGFALGLMGIVVMAAAFGSALMVALAMNANSCD